MIRITVTGAFHKPSQHEVVSQFTGELDAAALATLTRILPEQEVYTLLGKHFFYAMADAIDNFERK